MALISLLFASTFLVGDDATNKEDSWIQSSLEYKDTVLRCYKAPVKS